MRARRAKPLAGHDLHYLTWLDIYARNATRSEMAPFHLEAWEWARSLKRGERPYAFLAPWFRGGAKSTTFELILAWLAVQASRDFFLYVCATQVAANRHVQSVATMMERVGVKRAVNEYGFSKGWRGDMLRTANGFNVLALGLDTAVRGVKLDEFRPDGIILDDVDAHGDSIDTVKKKFDTITLSVLQAGSTDVAVAFPQNLIHQHSIMQGLFDGSRDMLRRRLPAKPVPAIEGLEWEEFQNEQTGLTEYKITAGRETWSGKDLAACEAEINATGIVPFLRECQHDVGAGGRFFRDWNPDLHLMEQDENGLLIQKGANPVQIEKHWVFTGGYDWGYGAPACFLLRAIDERGARYYIDEIYQAHKTDDEQADAIVALLGKWNLPLDEVVIYADPQMWAEEADNKGKKFQRVNAFKAKGLRFVKALTANSKNNRKAGWSIVRKGLRELLPLVLGEARQFPLIRIVVNNCPNLARTFPLQVYSKTDTEDLDTKAEDHAVDVSRFIEGAEQLAAPQLPDADPEERLKRSEFGDLILARQRTQNKPKL